VSRDLRSLDIFFVDVNGRLRHKLRRTNPDLPLANVQVDAERRVCIRLNNSPFHVSAENGGGGGVRVDRLEVHEWETFTMQEISVQTVDGGRRLPVVALRAHSGQYLSAEGQGGPVAHLTADRSWVRDWEKFRFDFVGPQADGIGGFQTQHGWYWCAEGGGGAGVAPNRAVRGPWETFRLIGVL
jgi:hypothetical protein